MKLAAITFCLLLLSAGSVSAEGVTNIVTNQGGGQNGAPKQCSTATLPSGTFTLVSSDTAFQPCAHVGSPANCDPDSAWTYIVRGHVTFGAPPANEAAQVRVQVYIGPSAAACVGGTIVHCTGSFSLTEDSTYSMGSGALNVSIPFNTEEKLVSSHGVILGNPQSFWVFAEPVPSGSLTCTANNYVTEEHN
jgi:hypothetical protein